MRVEAGSCLQWGPSPAGPEQRGKGHAGQLVSGAARPRIGKLRSNYLQFSQLWNFSECACVHVHMQESSPSGVPT